MTTTKKAATKKSAKKSSAKKSASTRASSSASNKKQGNRCWDGYEPTPGKQPGTKGSCMPEKK